MNVKDFFQEISGDYESVMLRFPSEDFALKFIIRFLDDTSFEDLCRNLEEGNYGEAFRAAHNLKGLGLSLGFTPLGKSAGVGTCPSMVSKVSLVSSIRGMHFSRPLV